MRIIVNQSLKLILCLFAPSLFPSALAPVCHADCELSYSYHLS